MAANKFATMLHKNCHKIIVILVYTFLEWILILLLLLNSFFSHLIQKFTNSFGLKQSCTWCCTLDHIFDSKKSTYSQFDHVCEAHGAQISKLSYCIDHKRLAESNNLCTNCSSSDCGANCVENRCSCCEKILNRSWDVLDYAHKKGLSCESDLLKHDNDDDQRVLKEVVEEFECDDPILNRSNEDDESVYLADLLLQNADYTDSERFICIELIDSAERSTEEAAKVEAAEDFTEGSKQKDCLDEYLSREDLMTKIKGQHEALKSLYEELEEERRASEEGAKETMAMITKLQEEKAAMQMEAIQYQRMMEEQAEYDQEALQLLNDLLTKRDKEKKELEKELQIHRNKALDGLESEDEYDDSDECLEEMGENVSLAEFDEERVSILDEVKILEDKLFSLDHDVVGKKLLPLFDATEFEECGENLSARMLIEGDLRHVYERLQSLEEDNDFLKHCIGSMVKGGNKGVILVQEILQHLRDLKCVEVSERNVDDIGTLDVSMIKED